MKLAVLSGKGGTGKTFVSVNLAAAAEKAAYIDCDVEEPNGRLFLKPEDCRETPVCTALPSFDSDKCTGCRKCAEFCHFNALIFIKGRPVVFPEICHSCGGCAMVCPEGAISESERPVGLVELGRHKNAAVVTGVLNTGEVSAVPVIKAALAAGLDAGGLAVIDCPPGSGCSVMESVSAADRCLIVAEPTAFGLHNFKMVSELAALLGKPRYAVINKAEGRYPPLEDYCAGAGIPVALRIPYSAELAHLGAEAKIACEEDPRYMAMFSQLLARVRGEAGT